MERQISQMLRLISDLHDIARVSSGKMVLKKSRFDRKTFVMEAVETTSPLMAKLKHHLSISIADIPICLHADPARLIQISSNWLNNAAKYTAVGRRIALTVEHQGNNAMVSVADSGIGIPPMSLTRSFEMFTAVGKDAQGTHEGLGIGLHLVRQLVAMHDGTVIAERAGVGEGSQLSGTLPINQAFAADVRTPCSEAAR